MPKFVAPAVLLSLALSTVGCAMNRPPAQSADVAWNTYKGRLSEQCGAKHLDLRNRRFGVAAKGQ